jgi:hypothetical protein
MEFFGSARLPVIMAASALYAGIGSSQQTRVAGSELRTQTIVASFNKSKHVVKERHGVKKEKYLRVQSVPAIKQNPADYSGAYEGTDARFSLQLRVDGSGKVEGTGVEPLNDDATVSRSFTLRDGRMSGALITATKVYASGSTAPFEGVFIDKTVYESPTDKGETAFGLGVVGQQIQVGGVNVDKLFYQLKR